MTISLEGCNDLEACEAKSVRFVLASLAGLGGDCPVGVNDRGTAGQPCDDQDGVRLVVHGRYASWGPPKDEYGLLRVNVVPVGTLARWLWTLLIHIQLADDLRIAQRLEVGASEHASSTRDIKHTGHRHTGYQLIGGGGRVSAKPRCTQEHRFL